MDRSLLQNSPPSGFHFSKRLKQYIFKGVGWQIHSQPPPGGTECPFLIDLSGMVGPTSSYVLPAQVS